MNNSPFFPELAAAIRQQVSAAVQYYREQYRHQHFYALGLGMVEDVCGFFIVGTTLEHWAAAEVGDDDIYRYWYFSEWDAEEFNGLPNLVHNVVAALAEQTDDNTEYDALRQNYVEHIIATLSAMRQAGELRNAQGEELWVWVQYADAYDEDMDEISFARLNAPELSHLFIHRFDAEHDNLTHFLQRRVATL